VATDQERLVVAVVNSNEDIVELVRSTLEEEGFLTVEAHIPDIRRGRTDFIAFLEAEDPGVIVYDIAPPFRESVNFLRLVMSSSAAAGRAFVLTTTNRAGLEEVIAETGSIELLGKPYDLDQIVSAVKRAAARLAPQAEKHGNGKD
jgi:DNA-binding NtrC family response regulator